MALRTLGRYHRCWDTFREVMGARLPLGGWQRGGRTVHSMGIPGRVQKVLGARALDSCGLFLPATGRGGPYQGALRTGGR